MMIRKAGFRRLAKDFCGFRSCGRKYMRSATITEREGRGQHTCYNDQSIDARGRVVSKPSVLPYIVAAICLGHDRS